MDKRTFLKKSSLILSGSFIIPMISCIKPGQLVGLQLYTVRNELEKNLEQTLQQIAKIGYNSVESAGYSEGKFYGKKPKEFKSLVNDLGISHFSSHVISIHSPHNINYSSIERVIESHAEAEIKYLVHPYIEEDKRQNIDDWKRMAESFNKVGELCNKSGLIFAYHNHDFEFKELEGQIPYDLLLNNTDPDIVKMELDLYWITKAGYNPIDYFQKYPKRFELWHIKDMDNSSEKLYTEVGNGVIDFQNIFKYAEISGLKHYYVELDNCKISPLKSIEISYSNMIKIQK